jgi:3-hydroxyisobutyrate dehydrogenase
MRHVAVPGTGTMGAGMARSMLRSGLDVTVWNRSRGRAEPLAADGAHVAGTAAFTVHGAVKDTGLIAAAMRETGTDAALMDAVAGQFRRAAGSGHGDQDMAAVFSAFRP